MTQPPHEPPSPGADPGPESREPRHPSPWGGQPPAHPQQGWGAPQGYPQQGYPQDYQPGYPQDYQQGYPRQGWPGGPQPQPQQGLRIALGARTRRRPAPRAGVSLAGAGAGLMIFGAFVWALGYFLEGFFDNLFGEDSGPPDTGRKFLGFGIFLVFAIAGYVLVIARRSGPIATAGAVLAALSVPLALLFVSIDIGAGLPVNIDAVYLGSIAIWLATYLLVPGARGRALFLTAVLLALPSYIGLKVAGDEVFSVTVRIAGQDSFGARPDTLSAGIVVLIIGVVLYTGAVLLDRRDRPGVSVAFVIAGFVTTAGGLVAVSRDADSLGTGLLLLVIGTALAVYGGWAQRRFTTWIWSAGAMGGIVAIVDAAVDDDAYVAGGVSSMIIGAVVVAVAAAVSKARGERPDIEDAVADPPGVAG